MTQNMNVKKQFNMQATNFDNWSVTNNEEILRALYNFFGIEPEDQLLDFACGTGAFSVYAAQKTKAVQGVDIFEKMIEIAVANAKQYELTNIKFLCCDVEKVPFTDESFDSVISKSAYHHMKNNQSVFNEMKRCCKRQGRIGIEDIISYDDQKLDEFFEELELEIDPSHHLTLSKAEVVNLFKENDVKVFRIFESVSDLNFFDYVNHAVQSEKAKQRINDLLEVGLKDSEISRWLFIKDGVTIWKRKVITIVGRKA